MTRLHFWTRYKSRSRRSSAIRSAASWLNWERPKLVAADVANFIQHS